MTATPAGKAGSCGATLAYVALGANLGEPISMLQNAMIALSQLPETRMLARSSLYRTAPVGLTEQPDFINAVVALEIPAPERLSPFDLLQALFNIEARFGRVRSIANAPRTLDLDLLLYGDTCLATPQLTLPHPRMHERAFVLAPLLEIAPDCCIPGQSATTMTLLAACQDQAIEKLSRTS